MKVPRKNLIPETDSESESQCVGQKSYVSPEWCCKIMDNRGLQSLDLMGVGAWPTGTKPSAFPFLTEIPYLFKSDLIFENHT